MSHNNAFLGALDLGGNLQRAIRGLSGLSGVEALALGVSLLLFDIPLAALCWHFDVRPTLIASAALANAILPSLPSQLAGGAALIGLLLTLFPTLAEFTVPRLAAAGFRAAGIAVYSLTIFDAFTDWPPVAAIMDQARGSFDRFGMLALPAWWLARLILLFMATAGLEMLFVVTFVCALHLLWQSRGGARAAKQGTW